MQVTTMDIKLSIQNFSDFNRWPSAFSASALSVWSGEGRQDPRITNNESDKIMAGVLETRRAHQV